MNNVPLLGADAAYGGRVDQPSGVSAGVPDVVVEMKSAVRLGVVVAALILVVLFAALPLAISGRRSESSAVRGDVARGGGLASLPLVAQGVVSRTLGASNAIYRVSASDRGLRAVNPAQHLRARFDRSGVVVNSGTVRLGLRLHAIGFGASLAALTPVMPEARGNRVVYARGWLSEWYANGPLGLEQGFTLARSPAGSTKGPLTLLLDLSGGAHASVDASGGLAFATPTNSSLRYDDLMAVDAGGRALRSWMTLEAGRVLLHVDARGARYPLRIDPLIQLGKKLVGGEEEAGKGGFGVSVALSLDGNTALIGGVTDNNKLGAAWVFTRSGGAWTQQGKKLTGGAEATGGGRFGSSVALSSDGNTALIGSECDGSECAGAAWVFTRSGGVWTQQGKKLTKEGAFGVSVALSSDGNTALIGGFWADTFYGAAWVYTRSGGVWTQQEKLTGEPEENGAGRFGASVALSSDGNTALIGGPVDNTSAGAVWVFTRSEGKWAKQGSKITSEVSKNYAQFGSSVALSSDGNTALVGEDFGNFSAGLAWVFTRSGGVWTQQGKKLAGKDETGNGIFGYSVTLSSDGNTALIGSPGDNTEVGAAWVFTRSQGIWAQQGRKILGGEESGLADFGASVALSSDGSTALVGGGNDSSANGAVWAFANVPLPEELFGPNPASPNLIVCECGKPVDSATGNETEQQTDIKVGGRGPGLRVVRSYNGLAAVEAKEAGPWGFGWTGSYDASLEINSGAGTATVHQDDGSTATFYQSGEGYTQAGWTEARLVKEGANYVYTLPDQLKLEFNSAGRLIKETERNGNSNTFTYNASNQLEKVTDGDSRTLTFKYKAGGQVESITDPMAHVVKYGYESGNLTSVTIEGKVRWKFEYNASHEMTKLTDGRGDATTMEYDTSHRVIKQAVAGHERKWKYGTYETTLIEPNGSETVERFNEASEPTEVTRAKGTGIETTTKYEYNTATYSPTKLIDPNKHETTYSYDSEGNKISEKDPNSDERQWEYDKAHNVLKETTPEGETTTIKRNEHGEPTVLERPIGTETQKTEFKYGTHGEQTEEIDPLKHATTYTYDAAGDKETKKDPEGNERKWKYNSDSQVTEETSPRGFITKTERDEQGRPTKITDALGHTAEYRYDANGNIESATDGNHHTTKYTYNEENLPVKVEEPNGTLVETGYDSAGQMTSHTDGNKHVWEYKRNLLEQAVEEKNPLGKLWKKTYEKAGHLELLEDPEKHLTKYAYDESRRLKSIKYSTEKPSEVTFAYNKDSKITLVKDETGLTENTWDKLDRLTAYKNGAGKVVKYEYNLVNEPTKITYPNEKAVTRTYDKDERLEKVTDWNSRTDTFGYNADSQLASITYPAESKYEDKYIYNEADQLTEIKYIQGGLTAGFQTYARDSDGQLTKATNKAFPGAATIEYKYDENDRLTEAGGLAYEYDKANNPTKIEGKGPYTYNVGDELEKGPEATYAYNEDGRRTETKPTTGPATTYGYDQVGNLTSVNRPEEGTTKKIEDSYTYDGNNLRQSQTINGTKTNLTWDTAEEEVPRILSDESNFYIYGPGNLAIEQITSAGASQWMHHDWQGSMRAIMNLKGEIESAYTFNPFGSLNSSSHSGNSLLRYDDEYTSTDNGLIYLRARTYDPQTAQFLSVDPALQTTGEPYAYTKDNPINQSDPTGNIPLWQWNANEWRWNLTQVSAGSLVVAGVAAGIGVIPGLQFAWVVVTPTLVIAAVTGVAAAAIAIWQQC
jgi:RHS repeat-associated protein